MFTSCELRIRKKTGSTNNRLLDQQAPGRVDVRDLACEDKRRRVHLLQHGRPNERRSPYQRGPAEDRRLDPARLLEVDGPQLDRIGGATVGEERRLQGLA